MCTRGATFPGTTPEFHDRARRSCGIHQRRFPFGGGSACAMTRSTLSYTVWVLDFPPRRRSGSGGTCPRCAGSTPGRPESVFSPVATAVSGRPTFWGTAQRGIPATYWVAAIPPSRTFGLAPLRVGGGVGRGFVHLDDEPPFGQFVRGVSPRCRRRTRDRRRPPGGSGLVRPASDVDRPPLGASRGTCAGPGPS